MLLLDLEQFKWWSGKEIKKEKGSETREDRRAKKDEVKEVNSQDNSRSQHKKSLKNFEM